MAISKKGKTDFLRGTSVSDINDANNPEDNISEKTDTNKEEKKENSQKKHKDINNWGRPRKLLIEGVKEKSITVQLPTTLISVLKKEGKKSKRSMKEVIGEALLDKYKDMLK